jgi:NADP-dependent 3-hydroxy acid dehydrogenase YdfG
MRRRYSGPRSRSWAATDKVDILVNSAGLNNPQRSWREQTVDGWDEVIRINLDGTFYCIRAVLPSMRARKDGLVINIASWAGKYTLAMAGGAYNGSKHAGRRADRVAQHGGMRQRHPRLRTLPRRGGHAHLDRRPVPPSPRSEARMLQADDIGSTIRWLAEQPPHVCVNEIIVSPTWNRMYVGGADLKPR